jgi:hypothetical protein
MSYIEVRDHALWAKHLHGNKALKEKILSMEAGEIIHLEVGGVSGVWVKMEDGKDGRPTPGLRAIGKAKAYWHGLQEHRGEIVTIKEVKPSWQPQILDSKTGTARE